MSEKMKFNPQLDGDTISKLGILDYDTNNLHPIELYGIRNSDNWHTLLVNNWHYSLHLSVLYLVLIYAGQRYMLKREPFNLRHTLTVWNTLLAVLSIIGTWRSLNVLIATVVDYGFMYSVCHPHFYYNSNALWGALFILSKPIELGDTVFIVLRKQPLRFIHWYHHITVMIYVFLSFYEHSAPGHYFYVVNYGVHAVMYTYYALRSLKVPMPKFVPVTVTSIQLSQMVVGTVVLSYVYDRKSRNEPCQITTGLLYLGLTMYLSYFLLFGYFFYQAYIKGKFWKPRVQNKERNGYVCNGTKVNGVVSNGIHSNGSVTNGTYGNKSASNGKKHV